MGDGKMIKDSESLKSQVLVTSYAGKQWGAGDISAIWVNDL